MSNLEKTIEMKILNHHRSETVFANIIPAVERREEWWWENYIALIPPTGQPAM